MRHKCGLCGDILRNGYAIDAWGVAFCSHHVRQCPRCEFCFRQVPLPRPSRRARDHRGLCSACETSGVTSQADATHLFRLVRRWLGGEGLTFTPREVPFRLLRGAIEPGFFGQGRRQTLGQTRIRGWGLWGWAWVEEVSVVGGLPRPLFEGVCAHARSCLARRPARDKALRSGRGGILPGARASMAEPGLVSGRSYLAVGPRDQP